MADPTSTASAAAPSVGGGDPSVGGGDPSVDGTGLASSATKEMAGTCSGDTIATGIGTGGSVGDTEKSGTDIVRIERGGEVTYHGPGQLVVYPILDLWGYKQDIHWYVRALEEAILTALDMAGVKGAVREDDVTGIWIGGNKVAALGVKVRRWATMHGLAVNVDKRSLDNFDGIVPCGLVGRDVTCINDHLDDPLSVEEFAPYMRKALEAVFEVQIIEAIDR